MRFCRFESADGPRYGLVEALGGKDAITHIIPSPFGEPWPTERQKLDNFPVKKCELLVPVRPSKIVCVGRSYREHAAELGNPVPTEPLLFLKPPSSLLSNCQPIRLPAIAERVDYEGELGVVIGRVCRKLRDDEDVRSFVRGYMVVNDVTARDLQNKDGQWTRAKGFDSFCPVGPFVTDEIDPWAGVAVETRVDGELKQQGNTRDFIFPLDVIIRYISRVMTLFPGDLISTGTPPGVGPLRAGNTVEVTVEGIGTLQNPVVAE